MCSGGANLLHSLLLSLAGCMGINVVMFLQKMKVELSHFKVELIGERNPTPPQYFKAIDLVIHIAGEKS